MDKILESPQLRKLFLLVFGLLLLVVILVRWFVIGATPDPGSAKELIARILDGYISSSLVTALIGIVIYFGTSEIRKASAQIEILPADSIKQRFVDAQAKTRTWYFKGGLGRFFTAETVPKTLNNGESGYRFRAYVVDPFNSKLCSYVASHRGGKETGVHIRTEALLTMVQFASQVHARRTSIAEAYCGLIDDFAPMRVDLTDEGVFITHDKATAPAMFYRKESQLYSSYSQELTTGPNSYLLIDLSKLAADISAEMTVPPSPLDKNYVSKVLELACAQLAAQRGGATFLVTDAELATLVAAVPQRKSPY